MKLLTPPIKDCRYIHRKLKQFYKENDNIGHHHPDDKEFKRAIKRFCEFYNVPIPKIEWYVKIDGGEVLGRCHDNGVIELLTPTTHQYGIDSWLNTAYHELGHYVLWADAETKAVAFAKRMMVKWRK